ncbi:uncharacterized protein LOC108112106 [Drosophila eugracilis]|uniref:uncharacterized protein LOC108112106 n=1 Tax=Drosophila eugracilis TaxID=29029 RepID=UPI0007E7A5ED|nr:uncharacterized protein LOC108112106 [Drosophila eugracilis]
MRRPLNILIALLVNVHLIREVHSLVEFTNFKCESMDKNFSDFEYCFLKSVNRTYKYISGKLKLFQIPLNHAKGNFGLYQFANGYKPFLYNITVDACKFLKNQKSNPVAAYLYNFVKDYSNMNHTCPYSHDLVVDKVSTEFINHRVTALLPFPEGKYMLKMHWIAYDIHRVVSKVYILPSLDAYYFSIKSLKISTRMDRNYWTIFKNHMPENKLMLIIL